MTETYVRAGKVNVIAKGSDVRVQERTLAPGNEIPWHYHTLVTDTTYCIEGTVRIEMLDPQEQVVITRGQSHAVPPNRPHRVTPDGERGAHEIPEAVDRAEWLLAGDCWP